MRSCYESGATLEVRGQTWTLSRVQEFDACAVLTLEGRDRSNDGVRLRVIDPFDRPRPVTGGTLHRRRRHSVMAAALSGIVTAREPSTLWTAADAAIDLWPYQLEPALAVLRGATRLLLADAVGLGKTVQAGLILSELRARGWIEHALVVCPAGLRDTWARELRDRFAIAATVLDQASIADRIASLPPGVSPWSGPGVTIASIDFVKRPEILSAIDNEPIDLIIADEAHHLAPGTDRGAAVMRIASRTPWCVLLSATPHSGDPAAFAYLTSIGAAGDSIAIFHRRRRDIGLAVSRRTHVLEVRPTADEAALLSAIDRYARAIWIGRGQEDRAVRLIAMTMARRAASSAAAIGRTLARRLALLSNEPVEPAPAQLPWEDADGADDVEGDALLSARGLHDAVEERVALERLIALAARCATSSKIRRLRRLLDITREPAVIFTEYRDTLDAITASLAASSRRVASIHGGLSLDSRRQAVDAFNAGRTDVLVATDAAGEGLNLHHRCRIVIDVELPWSPLRLEQRVGRVDRLGQRRTVHAIRLVHPGSIESSVLEHLRVRQRRAEEALARPINESDVAAAIFQGTFREPDCQPIASLAIEAAAEVSRRLTWHRRLGGRHAAAARVWSAPPGHRPSTLIALHRVTFMNEAGCLVGDRIQATRVELGRRPDRPRWRALIRALDAVVPRPQIESGAPGPLESRIKAIRTRVTRERATRYQPSLFDRRADASAALRHAMTDRIDAALGLYASPCRRADRRRRHARGTNRGLAGAAPVITGFGGGLISHSYVEERVLPSIERGALTMFERRMVQWWCRAARSLGPASSTRAVLDTAVIPLLQLLDHDRPATDAFEAGFVAHLPAVRSVLIVTPWAAPTTPVWRTAVRLGLDAQASWAMACNGQSLRIVDCSRPWARATVEFDFEPLVSGPKGIAALWGLARAPVLAGTQQPSLRSCIDESDEHASRVCRTLGDGVLSALPSLTAALAIDPRMHADRTVAFDQALTLIYRILFLLFAEARALVPIWNDVYRDAYTIDALTSRARLRQGFGEAASAGTGLWKAFQAISRLAHAGCKAGDLDVTAFNGRLFSPRHAPLAERRQVADTVMRDVLLALAGETTKNGRRRISYHDLGVEQLGSVYERILEHQPAIDRGSVVLARTSTRRKSTGSYYTPQALTEYLVKRTLTPLVEGKTVDDILRLRIVDPAMGSGAFLVAACVFLADCCEQSLLREGQWSTPGVSVSDRAFLRRQVAERCLYGVDLNPTAVQLARVSLWLTTLAANRPLTFLDHHLAAGNSLIGARLSDLSRPPLSSRGRIPADLPLFADQFVDEVTPRVVPIRLRLSEPSESIEIVKDKERAMAALGARDGPLAAWSDAADAWCAAALWPGAPPSAGVVREWIAAATGARTTVPAAPLRASLARAHEVAASHSAFHWELAFPEVFFDAGGRPSENPGFDAVIGNPPWDVLRADAGSRSERADSKSATAATLRYCRASRGHRRHASGHPNSYQLFLDRALDLARRGARIGLILPSGIATDHGSAPLRRRLLDRTTIDTWIGFDNRCRIFPIHRSVRFVVMTTTAAGATDTLRFRCGLTSLDELHRDERDSPPLVLSRSRIESWSPGHLAIPEVTTATALGIITAVGDRIPALGDAAGWHVRFGRELNATDDRPHFVARSARSDLLPIVEGKQLSPFQVDVTRSAFGIPAKAAARLLNGVAFSRARIAYRDVASSTNKLTLIAAMLPANVVSTHTVFCLKSDLDERAQWCLLGLLNSLVANYLVRRSVTTHVTAALMARLPVPRPHDDSPEFERLVNRSKRVAAGGIDGAATDYAELNSIAAGLYSISADDYAHILESFPLLATQLRSDCLSTYVRATEARNHGGT